MRSTRRRAVTVVAAAALMALTFPLNASAGKPSYACPPGFDLGALTFEESLQLAKVQRALDDGVSDEESLEAIFVANDHNGDELICFKTIPPSGAEPNPASLWQYAYIVSDNNASVPGT